MSEIQHDDNVLLHIANFEKKVQKRQRNQRIDLLTRLFFFILISATIMTYFFSPIGKVKIDILQGNYYYTKEDILHVAGLSNKKLLLSVDEKKVAQSLDANPRIKNAIVSWNPFALNININEIIPLARDINGDAVLSNGVLYKNYIELYPSYNLVVENLHLPHLLCPLTNDSNVIRFLENLKIIDKEQFTKIDFLDITLSEEGVKSLYYGLYYRISDDEYLRIRAILSVTERIYQKETFSRIIAQDYGTLKFNEEKNIHYRDAVCYMSNNGLKCAKN